MPLLSKPLVLYSKHFQTAFILENKNDEQELGFREKDILYSWESFEKENFDKPLSYFKQFYRKALKHGPLRLPKESHCTLSADQQQVYDIVSEDIQQGLIHQKMYLLASSAGSGKGTVIEALFYCALRFGIKAKISAPMGIACTRFPCLATTLHSSLGIPLGKTTDEIISMPVAQHIKEAWKDVKLFFIDECYLITSSFLYVINVKLQQIFGNSHPFGQCSIFLSGDILQSICIGGLPLYSESESDSEICDRGQQLYKSITTVFMLTNNHRQKDKTYLKVLEGVKHNKMDLRDLDLLNSRHESRLSKSEKDYFHDSLFISLKRDSVLNRNKEMLYRSEKPVIFSHTRRFGAGDDGILPLYLAEGCPVILNENINVNMGLVNGACGICRAVIIKDRKLKTNSVNGSIVPKPNCVLVEFKDINGNELSGHLFPIFPQTKNSEQGSKSLTIPVFPLETFYSSTILKVQGKTLSKVIVKVQPWFDWAPFFVAMSRVSNLNDLMIVGSFYSPDLFPSQNRLYESKMRELHRLESLARDLIN